MSFRSSAYAVVARIFKLIDSNGFTRLFFGPFTFQATNPGYAFRYEDPAWTDTDTEAGLHFGTNLSPDEAQANLYVIGKGGDTLDLAGVSLTMIDTGANKSKGATLYADDDNGGIGREGSVSILATSTGTNDTTILINALRSPTFCQIQLNANATRGEIQINADSLGVWTPVAGGVGFAAGWQDLAGWQQVQYRKVGDMVQIRGIGQSTGALAAFSTIFTLPAGFRPPAHVQQAATLSGAASGISVLVGGQVRCNSAVGGAGATIDILIQFYTST